MLLAAGCASTKEAAQEPTISPAAFSEVKAAPDLFKAQTVAFGGEVLTARRLKEGTRVESLQLPLDPSGRPAYDMIQSQSRFIARHREFFDPAMLPYGTHVTVTGDITGSVVLPFDHTEYTYPVINAKHIQVRADTLYERYPLIRPCVGPGPYCGLFWTAYWGPWPYRW